LSLLSCMPLLSILIPAQDRYKALIPVVQAITAHVDDGRLEISVCDNSRESNPEEEPEVIATNPNLLPEMREAAASIRPDISVATI
jgi:hypothetical protein